MSYVGSRVVGTTVYLPFHTFNAAGASVTITGLATSDIKIYKDGSTTERASTSGFTLLDTDGIDFDGITGLHGVKIDLSDNTTAGFYAAGSHYDVAIASITTDSQTLNFWLASFDIVSAAATVQDVVDGVLNELLSGHTTSGTVAKALSDLLVGVIVSSLGAGVITATSIASDAITAAKVADGAIDAATFAAGAINAAAIADGAIDAATFAAGAINAAAIAADAITDAKVAADVTIASVTGAVGSVTGAVGSVTGAVGSVTGNVGGSVGSLAAQAKADVNTEVVDCLNVDTYTEPGQGTPGVTLSIVAKLGYLFKNWRNKQTQTSTVWSLFGDDAVTVDQKATVADDGTTASKTEIASGP